MKIGANNIVLAAALACTMVLAGSCEKLGSAYGSRTIRFSAGSAVETKVYYGDEVNGYKQMIWEDGDQIRISSNKARTPAEAGSRSYHDYTLIHDREEGARSYAKFDLDEAAEQGLRWDESGDYDFWATYPPVDLSDNGSFQASVPSDSYLMVAHTNTSYASNKRVFLSFHPAFTAIELTINSDAAGVSISNCTLASSATALSGSFSASITDNGLAYYSAGSTSNSAEPSLTETSGNGKVFTFFCLPQELRNITLTCSYVKDGKSKSKSLDLMESGSTMVFAACKYHRLTLTLNSSGGDEVIDFSDASMGGCQMFLSLLKQNAWPLQQYAAQRNVYIDQNTAVNLFNYYVNNNVGQVDARDAFNGSGVNSFTATQLPVIKEFLQTLTTYYHQNSLWASIEASDFNLVPNLEYINQLEVDPQRVNNYDLHIDVTGLQHLKSISLYKCTKLTVKDCPELTSVSLMNLDNNVSCDFLLENCPKVTGFSQDWNGQRGSFVFRNMQALTTISLHNGAAITADNCPELTTITMDQASNLTVLSISDAPKFTSGNITSAEQTVAVSLNNCSNAVSSASILLRGNGNATNAGKVNSPNVSVQFLDWGGNQKASF